MEIATAIKILEKALVHILWVVVLSLEKLSVMYLSVRGVYGILPC